MRISLGQQFRLDHRRQIPRRTQFQRPIDLAARAVGESGVIGCIAEESGDFLRYLASLGLLPDTPVEVESVAPFGGPVLVRVAGSQYALGREVAGKILVRT